MNLNEKLDSIRYEYLKYNKTYNKFYIRLFLDLFLDCSNTECKSCKYFPEAEFDLPCICNCIFNDYIDGR